jgi:hypothetical protein
MAIAPRWCIHGLIAHFTREAPLADRQHAKISSSQVENISKKLDAIEAPGDSALSKQKAIAVLAPKLHAMRAKGYTWTAISAWLKDNGLDVTSVALQGYLRRARVEAKKNRAAVGRKAGAQKPADQASSAPPSTTAPTSASTPRNATAGPGSEKQPAERAAQPPRVRYGTFVPREDTKDI